MKDESRVLDPNEVTLWCEEQEVHYCGWVVSTARCWGSMCHGDDMEQGWRWCNKAIQELKAAADTCLRILPINLHEGVRVVFSDASLAMKLEEPSTPHGSEGIVLIGGPGNGQWFGRAGVAWDMCV